MDIKDTKWYKYIKENAHKFIVWFVFLLITALLVILAARIIESIGVDNTQQHPVDEVKIYFQKSVPDSLLNTLSNEVEKIQQTLDSMRQDSIAVSVQKVTK